MTTSDYPTMRNFEIKVTDGLDAYDELGLYQVDADCDDDTVQVKVSEAEKALEVLKKANLLAEQTQGFCPDECWPK